MTEQALGQDHEAQFRAIETEFAARSDHQSAESEPVMITMPTEVEFAQMAAEREARENAQRKLREAEHKKWIEGERREKWKGRIKKTIAATAILASYKSGGLIDMAADPFSDAGDIAAEAIKKPQISIPEEMDGISFDEFPAEAQAEMLANEEEQVENASRARDAVINLFHEADEHGYDGLVREVTQYKSEHPELFASSESLLLTKDEIDRATTNDEILRVLDEFMSREYGIGASYGMDERGALEPFKGREGAVKTIAKAYVEVFGALPKDFVSLAELESIQISNDPPVDSEHGPIAGNYSSEGEIRLFAPSPVLNATINVMEKLPYFADETYETVVAHELGHALDEHLVLPVTGSNVEANGLGAVGFIEFIGREVAHLPEYPSTYAATDGAEHSAEVLSGLLSQSEDGLASTEEWRRFGSESNKNMIRMLAQLEEAYPGIAKILVANRAK